MSLFSGLFKSRDKPQNRTTGSNYAFFFGGTTSGKAVTERSAMQMTAVYSCVRILSEAVAGLPLHLYKYTDSGGKAMALDHPLYRLLHDEPNPEMSSFVFRETLMTHLLLWGNAYVSADEFAEKTAYLQQNVDGLNSYVATLTETMESVSNDQGILEERLRSSESKVSQLQHTVEGLSVTMQEQYIGGINYVQNSSGLNGITDDWNYSGTVKTDASTDTQNNTVSDSCFVLGAYSSLSQYIRGVVPGTYTVSVRAKKTSTMSGYFYVTYNGNKTAYLFNKSTAFDWTDFTVTLTDVTDPTLRVYCYCRDASIYLADIMITEGAIPRKWTPAPNEIYTQEVKIDKRGIEVSNSASSQRTVITNTEFAGYYNDEVIFTLNKDETQTKKTTVDGDLTVGKTKFVPMPTASDGLNIVILD